MIPRRVALTAALTLVSAAVAACGGSDSNSTPAGGSSTEGFSSTREAAGGQTVRWWMYEGERLRGRHRRPGGP
ncbi:MAG: hypothetical protein ACR2LH_08590 [Thermoleophilaceae bacterium]